MPAFPVAGAVEGQDVVLRADLDASGNYLALTYQCDSDNPAAVEWFAFASRGRQEQGRRQDAGLGELVAGLANTIVWEFSGANTNTIESVLDFSVVQPLLRCALKATANLLRKHRTGSKGPRTLKFFVIS